MIARLPIEGGIPPRAALERLIARHGIRAVLFGMIAALIGRGRRRHRRPLTTSELSSHLRRDLGLPPHGHRSPRHWDHM